MTKFRIFLLPLASIAACAGAFMSINWMENNNNGQVFSYLGWSSESSSKAVTAPVFDGGLDYLIASIIFAVASLAFVLSVKRGRVRPSMVFSYSFRIALASMISLAFGLVLVKIAPSFADNIKIIGLSIQKDILLLIISIVIIVILTTLLVWYYLSQRAKISGLLSSNSVRRSALTAGKIKFDFTVLYASLPVSILFSAASFIYYDSFWVMFLLPALVTISLFLWKVFRWRFFFMAGFIAIMFHLLICTHLLAVSQNISSAPYLFLLFTVAVPSILPLALIYCGTERQI